MSKETVVRETESEVSAAGIEYHGPEEFSIWAKNAQELAKVKKILKQITGDKK